MVSIKTADGTFTELAGHSKISGKTAAVKFNGLSLDGKEVISITSHSRSAPTYAEAKLEEDILLLLQGKKSLDNPWITLVWGLPDPVQWPEEVILASATPSPPIEQSFIITGH